MLGGDYEMVEVTIRVTRAQLNWAIRHINNWLAEQEVNTEPDASSFVSALSSPVQEQPAD